MPNLITAISKLSITERLELVQAILRTITQQSEYSGESSLTDAQMAEIEARSASIASGSTPTVSWESIEVKLRQRYGL